jgi:hypothetical protein
LTEADGLKDLDHLRLAGELAAAGEQNISAQKI